MNDSDVHPVVDHQGVSGAEFLEIDAKCHARLRVCVPKASSYKEQEWLAVILD